MSGLINYLRFTIESKNWMILLFSIVVTTLAIVDEIIKQGEAFHSLFFLIPFVVVVAYTIHTFLQSRR